MDIVIPLGGKGERFLKEGYCVPKPLVPVGNKEMIRHVIDHLRPDEDDTLSILYHEQLDQHDFSGFIQQHYPWVRLVPIPFQTRGAVETIDYGLRHQQDYGDKRKCLLLDCDAFYTEDVVAIARRHENGVFVFREEDVSQPAKFSYVSVDGTGNVLDVAEKSRIGPLANTGAYLFKDRGTLLTYTQKVLDQDFRFCGEFYTSCVIKRMLSDHHPFRAIELDPSCYVSLGTPAQVRGYLDRRCAFLFDLDGTLVDTTDVYVSVWAELLKPYHARVDHAFFREHIDGNNDGVVLSALVPGLSAEEKDEMSRRKDALFLESVDKLGVIKGAVGFMGEVRRHGHCLGVVTNCNRPVAESILRQCGLGRLVDVLVIGNECRHPKPQPGSLPEGQGLVGV